MPTSVRPQSGSFLNRQRALLAASILLLVLAVLLFHSPAERQFGNLRTTPAYHRRRTFVIHPGL